MADELQAQDPQDQVEETHTQEAPVPEESTAAPEGEEASEGVTPEAPEVSEASEGDEESGDGTEAGSEEPADGDEETAAA